MGRPSARTRRTVTASRRQRGFTLLELMIVVGIVGILAAVAFPAFGELIKNSRRTTVVNELSSSLMLARAEAAKRAQAVSLCGLTSGNTCTSGTNWDAGWRVFLDPDNDGEIADPADVLRQYVVDYPDISVRTNGMTSITLRAFNQASTVAQVTVCDERGAGKSRRVDIAGSGRASVQLNNTEDAANGVDVTCPS